MTISYGAFLTLANQTWPLYDPTTVPPTRVDVEYTVQPPPAPGARLVRIRAADRHRRFWFSEWMVDDHGLYFRQVQVGERVSAITPPLRVTFNQAEQNTTARIFNGSLDGADDYYDGIVVEKQIMSGPDNSTEWKLRIKAYGNRTHNVGADVTVLLGAARILQCFGSCAGVFFTLKDASLFQDIEAAFTPPHPTPAPVPPQPVPPPIIATPGQGGGGAQVDTFGDYWDRLRKKRWDSTLYFEELDRYNEWAKGRGLPERAEGPLEKRMRKFYNDATDELRRAGHLPPS